MIPFFVSFMITVLLTPLTIKLAFKLKLVDDPKKRPHPAQVHSRVIPRAGGLPIFFAVLISLLLFIPFDKHILGIILGILVLLIIGLLDDYLRDFSPIKRLVFQIFAALIIVGSGVGISFITNPFGGVLRLDYLSVPINFLGTHYIVIIADLLALVWIVWLMNMVNWSKGVDGQMPGIVTIAALTMGFLSTKLYLQGDPHQLAIANLSFITGGAAFGFLLFNWYPAKIFPGFSGSTILGFLIATLSILSGAKLATALIVLLVPSVDFFYTFFRRIFSGKSPFLGDQKHLHHLLLQRGLSHRQISLFYILSCAILGLIATSLSTSSKIFVGIALGVIVFGAILSLHLFNKNEDTE